MQPTPNRPPANLRRPVDGRVATSSRGIISGAIRSGSAVLPTDHLHGTTPLTENIPAAVVVLEFTPPCKPVSANEAGSWHYHQRRGLPRVWLSPDL
jgi:hypothetical protein